MQYHDVDLLSIIETNIVNIGVDIHEQTFTLFK